MHWLSLFEIILNHLKSSQIAEIATNSRSMASNESHSFTGLCAICGRASCGYLVKRTPHSPNRTTIRTVWHGSKFVVRNSWHKNFVVRTARDACYEMYGMRFSYYEMLVMIFIPNSGVRHSPNAQFEIQWILVTSSLFGFSLKIRLNLHVDSIRFD